MYALRVTWKLNANVCKCSTTATANRAENDVYLIEQLARLLVIFCSAGVSR